MADRTESEFPKDGILWRGHAETMAELERHPRLILVFIYDEQALEWPLFRAIFAAMPRNEKLRKILNGPCLPMFLRTGEIPDDLKALGAGESYHIAILGTDGLVPMATFSAATGNPNALVATIADMLEKVAPIFADRELGS